MLFEQIEKLIYSAVCEYARALTKEVLEEYDNQLRKSRDKSKYKLLTSKIAAIKTVYGEVEYSRRYYNHIMPGGTVERIFLLDDILEIKSVGQYSENLAQIIADTATQMSYRQTAEKITRMTGIYISHGGVWEVIQALGERVRGEEKMLVQAVKTDALKGDIETKVLFEEMDGVYLSIQGRDRMKYKKHKQEMKVALAYRGWQPDGRKMKLVDKVMTAGFYNAKDFHALREADIRRVYNTDEIDYRILNGDGAAWIRDTYECDTIYQLDRFHIEQEITRCIGEKSVQKEVRKRFRAGDIEGCFDFIEAYANSLIGAEGKEKALEAVNRLYSYLSNNREGLLPYTMRGLSLPEPPSGILYRSNLGTQENHNYSVITKRMKNNRTSWSLNGATNMAKVLTLRENGTLEKTIRRYNADELHLPQFTEEALAEVLSASKAPKFDGKGEMVDATHLLLQDWKQSANIKAILDCVGL